MSPPTPLADPVLAAAQAAARAQLQALHDELAAASHAMLAARDAVPSLAIGWLGPASEAFRGQAARLAADVEGARADALAALAIVRAELA